MDAIQKSIIEMIKKNKQCLNDRVMLRSLLLDVIPENKLQQNLFLFAYDEGIINRLPGEDLSLGSSNMEALLRKNYGISDADAKWCVDTWCFVLGLRDPDDVIDLDIVIEDFTASLRTNQKSYTVRRSYVEGIEIYDNEQLKSLLDGHCEDADYIGRLHIFELLLALRLDQNISEKEQLSLRYYRGPVANLERIEEIKDYELATFLSNAYFDGPFSFEFDGRRRRRQIQELLKQVLVRYGVPEAVITDISKMGWDSLGDKSSKTENQLEAERRTDVKSPAVVAESEIGYYTCNVLKYVFTIPKVFNVNLHKYSTFRAFSETGDSTVMLIIETVKDEETKADPKWLYDDKLTNQFAKDFLKGLGKNSEASVLDKNVVSIGSNRGFFLKFLYKIMNVQGTGWLYRFPVVEDNQWVHIGLMQSDDAKADYYNLYEGVIKSFFKPDLVSVDDIDLGSRDYAWVKRNGYNYLNDLMPYNKEELMGLNHLGRKSSDSLEMALNENGLWLRGQYKDVDPMVGKNADVFNESIDEIGTSIKEFNVFNSNRIRTIGELISFNPEDFVNFCKRESLDPWLIIDRLKEVGVTEDVCSRFEKAAGLKSDEIIEQHGYMHKAEKNRIFGGDNPDVVRDPQIEKAALEEAVSMIQSDDYNGAIKALKVAVEHGFDGDYSSIGLLLMTGNHNVTVNREEGEKWLERFYSDWHLIRLNLDERGCIIDTCYNLGICWLWKIQDGIETEKTIHDVIKIWQHAVGIAAGSGDGIGVIESKASPINLFVIGCSFYNGEIHSEGHKNVKIDKDHYYARLALEVSARLGYVDANIPLADMYENGNGVPSDSDRAERYYEILALSGNKEAIDWCQEHIIDTLPWDRDVDWDNQELLKIPMIPRGVYAIKKIGIKTIGECRKGFFERASKCNDLKLISLRASLKILRDYMNNC